MLFQTEKFIHSSLTSNLNEINKKNLILLNAISFNWIKLVKESSTLIYSQPDLHNPIYFYPQSSQLKFCCQLDH